MFKKKKKYLSHWYFIEKLESVLRVVLNGIRVHCLLPRVAEPKQSRLSATSYYQISAGGQSSDSESKRALSVLGSRLHSRPPSVPGSPSGPMSKEPAPQFVRLMIDIYSLLGALFRFGDHGASPLATTYGFASSALLSGLCVDFAIIPC